MKYILIVLFLLSCGEETISRKEIPEDNKDELEELKDVVLKLEGTVAQINAFTASDFTDCSNGLPAFETKICEIAQTANAEQQLIIAGQLSTISKIFQDELYGEDCINTTDVGCPVAGSVTDQIASVGAIEADVAALQADVLQLQADLASINTRLDNFNGSGNSIEVVITGIEGDISTIESRLDDIEQAVNNGDIYKTVFLCNDNSASGPAHEPILITGDDTRVVAFVNSASNNGMGLISEAGVTGDIYLRTTANTRRCWFKVYDLTTSVKLCWNNSDRTATSAEIDTECDSANSFTSPTVNCTCAN